jgi:hypothetical protein
MIQPEIIDPNEKPQPTLVFYRGPGEGIQYPEDLLSLLKDQRLKTGILRARNPVSHDQWWIPIVHLTKSGVPYVVALAAVARAWLKEKKHRQVKLRMDG